MNKLKRISLCKAAKKGRLAKLLEKYLEFCQNADGDTDANKKKHSSRFPNLAGFCRFLGCGLSEIDRLREEYPEDADYILAVMEDEALNCDAVGATLMSTYFKNRIGDAKKDKIDETSADCGEVRVFFEHDIGEDGA